MWNIFRKKKEVSRTPVIDDKKTESAETSSENENVTAFPETKTIIYETECKCSMKVCISSDVGKIRENNEDNFYCDGVGYRKEKNLTLTKNLYNIRRSIFAVCDGMGGEAYGEEASRIAVETLEEMSGKIKSVLPEKIHETVNNYADTANGRICDMAEEKLCRRSGSTLAMVCIVGEYVYAFNIGDSRVYNFSDGKIQQITDDQTLAMRKLKANIYTEEEARNSSDAHKITSFLGVDDRRIGLHSLKYEPFEMGNGKILICSDGLTDMCNDEEISEILSCDSDNYAELLVNKALDNGGRDNVTCVVIQKTTE